MATISIIIPTYNRASVITATLNSVLAQSFSDWECLVVDDHSTDGTKDTVLEYCNKDSRFRYLVNTRRKGAQGARNTGLYASASQWVMFFDSDNLMHPNLLETLLSAAGQQVHVCKCFSSIIDTGTGLCQGQQDWIANGNISKALFDGATYVDFNQEIIRRDKMLEIGGLDELCPSLQEFDTNIRLSRSCNYLTVRQSLVDYCVGGADTISANYKKQVKGKYYNLSKFKRQWLENRKNADRAIYELYDKLRHVDSAAFKLRYALLLLCRFPQMIPFYARKLMHRS